MSTTEVLVKFDEVTHEYRTRGAPSFRALDDVSFEIPRAQTTAVLGRSGSGKSTLLNLMAGLDRPTGGRVEVAGAKLNGMSEAELAAWRGQSVGVVFQFFQLLPTLTVEENLRLAMELVGVVEAPARRARALELLELVGIGEQAYKLPAQLSGGQQQRAAIARSLANDPELLIADEPTGNLDSASAEIVLELFATLRGRGVTLVVVTHDETVAARADAVLRLSDGRLEGDPS